MQKRETVMSSEYCQTIEVPEVAYTVPVGGSRDPVNEAIIIENIGTADVVNPRVTVNGLYDWSSTERMAAEITRGCTTDEEKAFAIWRWVRGKRFQRSASDRSSLHPVRLFNVYGYGICGHTAAAMKALGLAAGVPTRVHEIWGHTISEFFWDDAWHVLDGNGQVFYPKRDNRTLASVDEVGDDPWISERSTLARFTYAYQSKEDNYIEHSYDEEIETNYAMDMVLRPGEKLIRHWNPTSGKYEGSQGRAEMPSTFANGQLIYEPDLRGCDLERDGAFNAAVGGGSPIIGVAKNQDDIFRKFSSWDVRVQSPYAVVGGRVDAAIMRTGDGRHDSFSVAVMPDGPEGMRREVYSYRYYTGPREIGLYLDPIVATQTRVGKYGYTLSFYFGAGAGQQAGIDRLKVTTDIQVSPHSLPALKQGENAVVYRDESPEGRQVRITHVWMERAGTPLPSIPADPVAPLNGGRVDSLAPTLAWAPTAGEVDAYHVEVSYRPDCAWPVSSSLDVELPPSPAEFAVPESWLNPGTIYYWRVRARDAQGDWGAYSPVWQFSTPG
jgi:hypothetical protein